MVNITKKDYELLYESDKNCRQSLKQLAQKLKSKKNVIAYRINRLEKAGIIRGYYTLIDSFLLGYNSYRIYFNLQNLTPEIEKQIINFFVKHKKVYFVSTIEGRYDLTVCLWTKKINELFTFFSGLMKKFRNNISNYYVMPYNAILFSSSYLVQKPQKEFWITAPVEKIKIDKLDIKILKKLSYNAKAPFADIALKNKTSANTIKYRIKKLKQLGVIKAFRADINFSLLGYRWFKVDINLNNYNNYNKILNFIKAYSNTFVIDKSVGLADIEAEFHYKNNNDLKQFMDKLISRFPGSIKNYNYFTVRKTHKIDFMPQ